MIFFSSNRGNFISFLVFLGQWLLSSFDRGNFTNPIYSLCVIVLLLPWSLNLAPSMYAFEGRTPWIVETTVTVPSLRRRQRPAVVSASRAKITLKETDCDSGRQKTNDIESNGLKDKKSFSFAHPMRISRRNDRCSCFYFRVSYTESITRIWKEIKIYLFFMDVASIGCIYDCHWSPQI